MTKYIVVVEFGKNVIFGNDEGLFDGVCRDYVQDTISCKEEMLKQFNNNILALSTTSYLIRSNETEKELLETIKQLVKSRFDKEFYDFKHQVYVASINGFEFATFREKGFEVDYINRD